MFWLNGNRMRLVLFGAMAAMVFGGGSAKADFTFGRPFNLGLTINSQYQEYDPIVSSDGLELYFCSNRPQVMGWSYIFAQIGRVGMVNMTCA